MRRRRRKSGIRKRSRSKRRNRSSSGRRSGRKREVGGRVWEQEWD